MTARALGLAVLVSSSCASTTPFVVSGQTLDALGAAVEATHARYLACFDDGTCARTDVEKWDAFLVKFQAAYPSAVALWRTAVRLQDDAMAARASGVLGALAGELAPLAGRVGVPSPAGPEVKP